MQKKRYFCIEKPLWAGYTELAMMNFDAIEQKMQSVGLSRAAVDAFRHSVGVLTSNQSMEIPESDIEPAQGVADWEQLVAATPEADAELLAQAVEVIKQACK